MAYDAVAESLRLIESRELPLLRRLSRRRRHAAMAVDVSDDIAVTVFARRSVGCNVEESHVFARHGGEWTILGGGGGRLDEDAFEDRPARLPLGFGALPGVDGRIVAVEGAGGIRDSRSRGRWPARSRWINYCTVRVNADVAGLVMDGRDIAVPWHGRCVVVWRGRRRPQTVAILAHDGSQVEQVILLPTA